MTATITRSTGIIPKVNGRVIPCFPLPGGGYQGATRKLDRAVATAARWMHRQFGLPITIRFNSDRWSGGAFLVDPKRHDAGVQVGARIVIPDTVHQQYERRDKTWLRLPDMWKPTEADTIVIQVGIDHDLLLDPAVETERYFFKNCPNLRAGYRLLLQHLDAAKVMTELTRTGRTRRSSL